MQVQHGLGTVRYNVVEALSESYAWFTGKGWRLLALTVSSRVNLFLDRSGGLWYRSDTEPEHG